MLICSLAYLNGQAAVDPATVQSAISVLTAKDNGNKAGIEKGVNQVARLWLETDGDEKAFRSFCEENYIADPDEKYQVFLKISDYIEGISGHFNEMSLRLQKNLHLDNGPLLPIDEKFGSYSPSSHLSDDLYNNKIAFIIALNFPHLTLEEKEALGTDRKAWAYARLGDMFTERIPAALLQAASNAESDADIYISQYNIYMGHVMNKKGQHLFPKDMILLSHWNLRYEIKAN